MPAAGDKVLAADVDDLEDYTIRRPLVRLIQQAAQSIPSATDTALTFGAASEEIDTHGFHDTASNTSRITPTIEGYYQLTGAVCWAADTDIIRMESMIGKNGTVVAPRMRFLQDATATANLVRNGFQVTAIQSANGTTDYFEFWVLQVQTAAGAENTSVSGTNVSVFECTFLRPL